MIRKKTVCDISGVLDLIKLISITDISPPGKFRSIDCSGLLLKLRKLSDMVYGTPADFCMGLINIFTAQDILPPV